MPKVATKITKHKWFNIEQGGFNLDWVVGYDIFYHNEGGIGIFIYVGGTAVEKTWELSNHDEVRKFLFAVGATEKVKRAVCGMP